MTENQKYWWRLFAVLLIVTIVEVAVDKALGLTFDDVSWLVEYTHKGVRFAGGLVVGAVLFHRT